MGTSIFGKRRKTCRRPRKSRILRFILGNSKINNKKSDRSIGQIDLYYDYAYELFEKIQNRIHRDSPINYKQGLSGIGSAIEYLVQNGYFNADTDEVLEDFDRRIFFTYNLPYLSVREIVDVGYETVAQ